MSVPFLVLAVPAFFGLLYVARRWSIVAAGALILVIAALVG